MTANIRYYNKLNKTMNYCNIIDVDYENQYIGNLSFKDATIMNRIPFLDIFDKAIYIGDIVQYDQNGINIDEVVNNNAPFICKNETIKNHILNYSWFKVIGNIYENPELLNK